MQMMEREPETKTMKVFSPIATRTRRSSHLSNTPSPVPMKKRRSSIKRKSLAETLQCVEDRPPIPAVEESTCEAPGSSSSKTGNIDQNMSGIDGVNSIYTTYAALEEEAKQWNRLLRKYKQKEAHATETAQKFLYDETPSEESTSKSLDYEEIVETIVSYEHRLTKAVKCISRAAEAVVDIQEKLDIKESKLSDLTLKDSVTTECDPRDLLEGLLSFNKVSLSHEENLCQNSEIS